MSHGDYESYLQLLEGRRSASPRQLDEPGPDLDLLRRILGVAMRVPDHGRLEPWRFIVLQGDARIEAAKSLAAAFTAENHDDTVDVEKQIAKITGPLIAAPVTVVVVSSANPEARKPEWEQILSAGAVCMNLLIAAKSAGFAGVWLTGWAAYNHTAKQILGINLNERVAGIIHLGTENEKQKERPRPDYNRIVTYWDNKSSE